MIHHLPLLTSGLSYANMCNLVPMECVCSLSVIKPQCEIRDNIVEWKGRDTYLRLKNTCKWHIKKIVTWFCAYECITCIHTYTFDYYVPKTIVTIRIVLITHDAVIYSLPYLQTSRSLRSHRKTFGSCFMGPEGRMGILYFLVHVWYPLKWNFTHILI